MFDLNQLLKDSNCMSKYRLAQLTGISKTTLTDISKGKDCRVSTLKKICEAVNVKLVIDYIDDKDLV